MTKEEILDYVMNTPENTNRMVLSDMLDEFNSGGGAEPLLVEITMTGTVGIMDKTITEIDEALTAGTLVVISIPDSDYTTQGYSVVSATQYYSGIPSRVYFITGSSISEWSANGEGYPAYDFDQ